MSSRNGVSFVDVLIILAIVLLLAALAVPRFIKVPDYGNEEDVGLVEPTNQTTTAATATNASAAEVSE
jgi:hypothetical protein